VRDEKVHNRVLRRENHPRLKHGTREGARGLLTEAEAEQVRVALGKRLVLPTAEEVATELGQPVYLVTQVAQQLSLCRATVISYGEDLGMLIQIRNGILPTYVISAEGVTKIWEAHQSTKERLKKMLQAQARAASHIGGRQSQHKALMREDRDYYGKVQAFAIEPKTVENLSSELPGGPEFRTLQWIPFYLSEKPNPDQNLSVWNVTDHREHLSLDAMRNPKDGEYRIYNGKRQRQPF